ncbi:MAG: Gfo/Idh/MocA family oxidoreductase [Lactobacillaceae bacterium]|jgi:virulence factor|nr:Gfo/Idh/MocA family oxidoreductase [Lactobacillaceae bacterium]
MKLGIIGTGGVAQKAYLPLYAQNQDKADFIISSRSIGKAWQVQEKYNFVGAVQGVDELLEQKVDAVMIHSKTDTHFQIAKTFLENDVNVFVDKPISQDLDEIMSLQFSAKQHQKILMAGFNRRFAPFVDELKKISNKKMIVATKNRANEPSPTEWVLYDLFIHPLDTAIYLLDEPIIDFDSHIQENNGLLESAYVILKTPTTTAIVSMNLMSGANLETFQVQAPSGTYTVDNLSTLKIDDGESTKLIAPSNWQTNLTTRGFEPMVISFIAHLGGEDVDLRQENVLVSHQIIRRMLEKRL